MKLGTYLMFMIFATILSAIGWVMILITVDPFSTNILGFILFYTSLFLTIMGVFSILGFIIRFIALKRRLVVHSVIISFRQAFLISFVFSVSLFLLSQGLFSWLSVLLLIIGFSALEFFLISLTNH